MKALFKLKKIPYIYENQLSNEKAEEYYRQGNLPFDVAGWGNGAVHISCGFYSKKLTFSEWIDRYKLKII